MWNFIRWENIKLYDFFLSITRCFLSFLHVRWYHPFSYLLLGYLFTCFTSPFWYPDIPIILEEPDKFGGFAHYANKSLMIMCLTHVLGLIYSLSYLFADCVCEWLTCGWSRIWTQMTTCKYIVNENLMELGFIFSKDNGYGFNSWHR